MEFSRPHEKTSRIGLDRWSLPGRRCQEGSPTFAPRKAKNEVGRAPHSLDQKGSGVSFDEYSQQIHNKATVAPRSERFVSSLGLIGPPTKTNEAANGGLFHWALASCLSGSGGDEPRQGRSRNS